jgi:IPT/TIG domain
MRRMGTGSSARTATAAVLLAATGCGANVDQPAVLDQMTPSASYYDVALTAIIYGTPFRPTYEFDAVSGNTGIDVHGFSAFLSPSAYSVSTNVKQNLSAVVWEASNMLQAVVPAGIALGTYDLVVRDPRGQTSRLQAAFNSLGPDLTAPVVTIVGPVDDSIVGAQAQVPVVVEVSDGPGQVVSLEVNLRTDATSFPPHDCSAAAQAKTACTFSFMAPSPTSGASEMFIDATATDSGGNVGTAETVVELVPAPVATSLSPASGSTAGGTSVTLLGANFLAGETSVAFDGAPASITTGSATSFTVLTPPHIAGLVNVTVETGGAPATFSTKFLYVDPPIVRAITPAYGPVAGGTAVRVVGDNFNQGTQISIGGLPLEASAFDNANLIEGVTPVGSGPSLVGAFDPILTAGTIGPVVFNYGADGGIPTGSPGGLDGGVPIPCLVDAGCSGGGP